MKNIKVYYVLLLLAFFAFSCEDTDNGSTDETIIEISDDYNLLVASDLGEIFQIGNNSGNIKNVGQIDRESNNSLLPTTSLIGSENKIYAIEYIYKSTPTNNLLIFDKQKETTQIIPLTLPSNIIGYERQIYALAWNNNDNLIGVLAENVFIEKSPKHLVNINLQNNSVTDLGITFTEDRITSMKKINSKLYLSTTNEGFLIIDLNDKTVNRLNSINGSKMAIINDLELAIMQTGSGFGGTVIPSIINLTNLTISDTIKNENFGLSSSFGNSIYKNEEYLNFVTVPDLQTNLALLKTNFKTNKNTIVRINSDASVNINLIILDTTN